MARGRSTGSGRRAGSIRQLETGAWEISAEGPPRGDGKRARRYEYVTGGRRDADRALAQLIADLHDGRVVADAGTFGALLERWWSLMTGARWQPATALRYRQDIDAYLVPELGRQKVDRLTADDLTALYERLRLAGKAPRTIQHLHGTARAALSWAMRQGKVSRNVADAATVPVRRRVARPLPTRAQLEAVLELAAAEESQLWHAWLRVSFGTGARPGEICALRWSDIDLDRGTVRFAGAIGRAIAPDGRAGWAPKGTKTETERRSGVRTVSVDLGVQAALRRWRAQVLERAVHLGVPLNPDWWVFPADAVGQRHLTPATPTRRWRRYAAPSGVGPEVRLYDASRHYHASWALDAGFSVAQVAERLGNSPATVWARYAGTLAPNDQAIADALDREAGREARK